MKVASFVVLLALTAAGIGSSQAALPSELPPAKGAVASDKDGRTSPAAQTAEGAQPSDKLGPEKRVVPQISVQLKRGKDEANDKPSVSASAAKGGVDDTAARCRAKKTKQERAACESEASSPARPPRVEKTK